MRRGSWPQLAEALARLGRSRHRRPPGAGRASFRLSEVRTLHDPADPAADPDDQTGDGTRLVLEFFLQSTADPSLLVPAEQVWDGRAARLLAEPQELLLAELGRAAPRVARRSPPRCAQARPRRSSCELGGAHEFLTADAPLLVAAGFGVQLPAGWDGSRRVGLTLSPRSTPADRVLTRSGLGRESWPTSAGRSPSATTSCPRRSWPSWWRPRRRWCGCAAGG